MHKRLARFIVVLLGTAACFPDLGADDDRQINCAPNDVCPADFVCASAVQRCVTAPDDRVGPVLLTAESRSVATVVLTFDERVAAPGASMATNYAFAPPLAIAGISIDETGRVVTLTVNGQVTGQLYAPDVSAITDWYGNPATADGVSFSGSGVTPDRAPPLPLAPLDGAVVGLTDVVFAWTAPSGAQTYTVTIATDFELTAPIPGSPFTVAETSLVVPQLPSAVTYYWSVQADVTSGGAPVTRFASNDGVIRVYCADGEDCAADVARPESGNLSHPFRSIDRALSAAAQRGDITVRVRSRGTSSYDENVFVTTPVELSGGWNATFDNHPSGATTTLTASQGPPLRIGLTTGATNVHDFTVRASADAPALYVAGAADNLTIHDCVLEGASGPASYAAHITGSGSVELTANRLLAHGAPSALVISGSSARVRDNIIQATEACASCACNYRSCARGVRIEFGGDALLEANTISGDGFTDEATVHILASAQATLRGNTIVATDLAIASFGAGISALRVSGNSTARIERNKLMTSIRNPDNAASLWIEGSRVTAINNVIHADRVSGNGSTFAVDLAVNANAQILNNTLVGGVAGPVFAFQDENIANETVIANNLIAALDPANSTGFFQESVLLSGFNNNVIVNVSKGYVTLSTEVDPNTLNRSGMYEARYENNRVVTGGPSLATIFVNLAGADGDRRTIADNDYRLKVTPDTYAIASSGMDLTDLDVRSACYAHEFGPPDFVCAPVLDDLTGNPRTPPLSVGAYEKN